MSDTYGGPLDATNWDDSIFGYDWDRSSSGFSGDQQPETD